MIKVVKVTSMKGEILKIFFFKLREERVSQQLQLVLHMDIIAFIVEFVKVMSMILMNRVKGENLQQMSSQ